MARDLKDGEFRVSVCAHGHVTLEAFDGESVVFVSVLSRVEAFDLGARLVALASGCLPYRHFDEVH